MNVNPTIALREPAEYGARRHESAHNHVSGRAEYIDDMPVPAGTLHAYLGLANCAHGRIRSIDLDEVRASPGVLGVLTASDIPGLNDVSPTHVDDDPVFADELVQFWGQPVFAVVAETRKLARRAARKAKIAYEELPHVADVAAARAGGGTVVTPGMKLERGDVRAGLRGAKNRISGAVVIGGQEHFYLEGQVSLAVPGENAEVLVYCSSQHPDEVQRIVAQVLGVPYSMVNVVVRRMGGGFGGKETQCNLFACVAAMAAKRFGRAVKIRPDRDDDMTATGKRHDFVVDYDVGFDDDGRIEAVDARFFARCGYSADLSRGVTDRALMHADNCYFFPNVRVVSEPLKTNTVSNTAFRGYGGPQGLLACERWIENIACATGKDPLAVRKANFYADGGRDVTPYHQVLSDNIIARVVDELERSCEYQKRRSEILDYNRTSRILRRGISLVPLKFGISFTHPTLNQAGALVHIYRDGSVHLNHGGTEMGQGLHTKMAQVLATELRVDFDRIAVTATTTGKVPNASSTAASTGTDLNGMAVADAARQLRSRLVAFAVERYGVPRRAVVFRPGLVQLGAQQVPWATFVEEAYRARVHLSAAGFYKTPDIHWDRATGSGKPYFYFSYGASCTEVTIDTLTGEYVFDRVDILHDVGRSLNPAIDLGQVEGGFIQGLGWLTTEELWWDGKGRLRTHAPSTYKIPLASDVPKIFNVELAEWSVNASPTIGRSKAVGEPPLPLAISAVGALSMAVASVADYRIAPDLETPVTPERVLMKVEGLRALAQAANS